MRRMGVAMILAKFLRLHHGWQLRTAAQRTGVTESTLCLIERGRFVPTDAMLQRIADAFGVAPPSALLRDVTPHDFRLDGASIADIGREAHS
jgi:transcriptional regulator with XRE-family HTH domain